MENKANYALIGAFVLIATLALTAFAAWLSNAQFDQKFEEYEVVFTGAVKGLSRGSEVRYNGLRVGEVIGLKWDEEDTDTIIARIQVVVTTPVHTDSEAQLEPQGLTGLNYVQITPGPSGEAFRGRGPYQIQGRMSQFDTLLGGGENIIEGTQNALRGVNATLNPEAISNFHGILSNINQITTNLKDTDVDPELVENVLLAFEQAAKDVSTAALAVDDAAVSFDALVTEDVKGVLASADISLGEVNKTLAKYGDFADGGTLLTEDARDAINRISNSGLTDLEETADGIRRLILSLNEIAIKLERSPAEFFVGEQRETMELPQ